MHNIVWHLRLRTAHLFTSCQLYCRVTFTSNDNLNHSQGPIFCPAHCWRGLQRPPIATNPMQLHLLHCFYNSDKLSGKVSMRACYYRSTKKNERLHSLRVKWNQRIVFVIADIHGLMLVNGDVILMIISFVSKYMAGHKQFKSLYGSSSKQLVWRKTDKC